MHIDGTVKHRHGGIEYGAGRLEGTGLNSPGIPFEFDAGERSNAWAVSARSNDDAVRCDTEVTEPKAGSAVALPIYLGPLKESRLLEPLEMAWIVLARHRGLGRDFALEVVRRPGA